MKPGYKAASPLFSSRRIGVAVTAFLCLVLLVYYLELEIPVWRRQREELEQELNIEVVLVDNSDGDQVAVVLNKKEDREAQIESDTYFQDTSNNETLSWPTRSEDYAPLVKGSAAKEIFKDEGRELLKPSPDYVSPAPLVLSKAEKSSGIHIITTFFHGSYEDRRFSEVVAALVSNLENPYVSFVHAMWEKEDPTQYIEKNAKQLLPKLVAIEAKHQPTYAKMFKYVNENLERGSLAIVTNADIYFDSALRCLKGPDPSVNVTTLKTSQRTVYALSRRHTALCGKVKADHGSVLDLCEKYVHSHDAFVFAPPVSNQVIKKTNHMQNRYGGENIVIWEFTLAGYRVMNPCKKVHAIHLHCSAERHYLARFIDGYQGGGPYRHGTVWPGTVRTDTSRKGWIQAPVLECGTALL